jgi:hypothetical protein
MTPLERDVRILKVSNLAGWGVLAVLALGGFTTVGQGGKRLESLDVERLNIVGANGKPVLVLANRRLIPGPSMNGKDYPRAVADGRELMSGMIFFNDEGDEVGGLIFNGFKKGDGHSAVGHLSFDQWKQNQVVAIQYVDSGTSRRAGLGVWDRPTDVAFDAQLDRAVRMMNATGEEREGLKKQSEADRARGASGVQRVFVGSRDKTAQVELHDTRGRVRARLYVDQSGEARLDFLDEAGQLVAQFPHARVKR